MHWSSKEKCVKGAGRRLARLSDTLALRFHQCRAARDWPVATRMAPWSHIRSTPAPTLTSNWSDCELPRLLCKPNIRIAETLWKSRARLSFNICCLEVRAAHRGHGIRGMHRKVLRAAIGLGIDNRVQTTLEKFDYRICFQRCNRRAIDYYGT